MSIKNPNKLDLQKKFIAGLGIGALTLSLAACSNDDDNDNNASNNGPTSNATETEEPADDNTEMDSTDEELVVERAASFFEATGEVEIDYEAMGETEEEQEQWVEDNYQDIVWEYFNIEDEDATFEDLEYEYMLSITASTLSSDFSEVTDGVINMNSYAPDFFPEHTEITDDTAVTQAFLIDTIRELDNEQYEDVTDEEIMEQLVEGNGTFGIHLNYEDGEWYIDAMNTFESLNNMNNIDLENDDMSMDDNMDSEMDADMEDTESTDEMTEENNN